MMRFSTGKKSTTSRIIAATYPIHVLVHELRQLGLALEVTKYASSDPTAVEKRSYGRRKAPSGAAASSAASHESLVPPSGRNPAFIFVRAKSFSNCSYLKQIKL
jgi:hypothetical protein